jgi:DTW domain-containing protein YfiP
MNDSHLPTPNQWCTECLTVTDHCWCAAVPDGAEAIFQMFVDP